MITVLTNSSDKYPFKRYIIPHVFSSKGLQVGDDGVTRGDFKSIEKGLIQRAMDKLRANHISDFVTIDYATISRLSVEVRNPLTLPKKDTENDLDGYTHSELNSILDSSGCRGEVILSGALPMPDCIININKMSTLFPESEFDSLQFRIHIYKELVNGISREVMENCDKDTWIEIGVAGSLGIFTAEGAYSSDWLRYKDFNHICLDVNSGLIVSLPVKDKTYFINSKSGLYTSYALYYGAIQYAMLNPATKKSFKSPTRQKFAEPKVTTNNGTSGNKSMKVAYNNKKVRYIKNYVITEKDYDEAIDEYSDFCRTNGYTRRTMSWYVRGHFRHMKDDKVIFIKGYWKGPYREFQMNMDLGRIRELK